jgi:hypothetical protein
MSDIVVDPVTGREVQLFDAFAYNGQYKVKARGYFGTATAGTTTDIDFAIGAQDRYINGARLLAKGAAWGDSAGFLVVDKDGVYAGVLYPPDTPLPVTLSQFIYTWAINDQVNDQGANAFPYVARIPAGTYIRVSYTSVGATDVQIALNALLHMKNP